jgi:acyl dehydratase
MPLAPHIIGIELEPEVVEVTARMTLAYAAGIGDVNGRTFDDTDDDFMAPPFFCTALEWPVLSRNRAGLGLGADELLRVVHVEHDSLFHRPIRPGDRLRTGARIVAGRATRAGAFIKTRVLTADANDNTPVSTSWHGSIYRGTAWSGPDAELEANPPWPRASEPADRHFRIATAPVAAHVYTECSGIWNPIHTERRAALAAGLRGIILHGTAIWALAGRELIRAYAQNEPVRLRRLRARFAATVAPGESLTLYSSGSRDSANVHFVIRNGEGRVVVDDGFAEFSRGDRLGAGAL